jgi:hypothetical protein
MSDRYPGGRFCAKITALKDGGFSLSCYIGFKNAATGRDLTLPVHDNPGPIKSHQKASAEAGEHANAEGFRSNDIDWE